MTVSRRTRPPLPRGRRRGRADRPRASTSPTRRSATLLVAATDRGLCQISFDPDRTRARAARRSLGRRVLRVPRELDAGRRELDEYFEGRRHDSTCRWTSPGVADFNRAVLDELARVPYGELTTYGALARAGRPAPRRPRGGRGDEPQPDPDRASLPPRRRRDGASRLRRRPRAQAAAARARGLAPELAARQALDAVEQVPVGAQRAFRCGDEAILVRLDAPARRGSRGPARRARGRARVDRKYDWRASRPVAVCSTRPRSFVWAIAGCADSTANSTAVAASASLGAQPSTSSRLRARFRGVAAEARRPRIPERHVHRLLGRVASSASAVAFRDACATAATACRYWPAYVCSSSRESSPCSHLT